MHYRQFGSTELKTSQVGIGCARLGGVFQDSDSAQLTGLLRQAYDAGITFFDTADMYTQGDSERLLGAALREVRDRVIIATKFGYCLPARKQLAQRIKPLIKPIVRRLGLTSKQLHSHVRGSVTQQDFSAGYIRHAVEASLRRLRTDYIDVYQLHDPPLDVLRRGDFVEPLEQLRSQGKIRYWGVASQRSDDVLDALDQPGLDSIQVGLSALEQSALDTTIPRAAALGAAVIARQVYASGLLTRPVETIVTSDLDPEPEIALSKQRQIAGFAAIARQCGRSQAELALQYALACQPVSVVLLGVSRKDQLDVNLRALTAAPLSNEERTLLAALRRHDR